MPAVTAAALEPVSAFPVEKAILIKHYFDGDEVFGRLRPYYNGSQYRFEVPVGEFDSLRRFPRHHGYDVSVGGVRRSSSGHALDSVRRISAS